MLAAMELRHLRYFIAVAQEENVTRAAQKLHVSQPALSRQIRDLEEELGITLLERGAKSIRMTEAGRIFLDEARAVMARVREAVDQAKRAAGGQAVEIHVGYAPSLTVLILPNALRAFQKELPGARVILHDLSTEEMLSGLRAARLDIALMIRPTRAMLRGLAFEELARYPLCLAVPPKHPLARRRSATPEQAAREPLIAYSRSDYPEYHEDLGKIFSAAKARPRIAEEHDSVTSLIAAVEAGRGVALAPSCLACMVGPRLKLVPLKPPPREIVVGAAWVREKTAPAAEQFLRIVRSQRPSRPRA
jgi:DNA-binding transcriptional LysR family regulator